MAQTSYSSGPLPSFASPDPSAIANIIKQQQMEEDLKKKSQENAIQEIILDQLRGYGSPDQRNAQLSGGPGLSAAIANGANSFSNINPEGGYSFGGGTPSEMIPGMKDMRPATSEGGAGGMKNELVRKGLGLPSQSPEQQQGEKVMLQFLQNFFHSQQQDKSIAGQKDVAEHANKLPVKQPIAASTPETEILSAVISGKELSPGQQKAWDLLHPVERDAAGLTKMILKDNMDYMLADPQTRVKMELEALASVTEALKKQRGTANPATGTPAPETNGKKYIAKAAWAQLVKKHGSVAKAKIQAESQGYDLSRYAD